MALNEQVRFFSREDTIVRVQYPNKPTEYFVVGPEVTVIRCAEEFTKRADGLEWKMAFTERNRVPSRVDIIRISV